MAQKKMIIIIHLSTASLPSRRNSTGLIFEPPFYTEQAVSA